MQAKLEAMEIDGVAGAGPGARHAERQGRRCKRIKIDPKVVDPTEVEMLEDLIVAAHADAKEQDRRRCRGARCRRSPAGCNLPPGMKLPF